MTVSNSFLNPAFHAQDVRGQVNTSQSTGAANTISATHVQQAMNQNQTRPDNSSKTMFGTLTQAYKDSYDKYQKDKGSVSFASVKSLFELDKLLETEDLITQRQQENAEKEHYALEYLA